MLWCKRRISHMFVKIIKLNKLTIGRQAVLNIENSFVHLEKNLKCHPFLQGGFKLH
jgi:hypothetical protein